MQMNKNYNNEERERLKMFYDCLIKNCFMSKCKRNQTWDELEVPGHQQPLLQMQRKQLLTLAATSSPSSSLACTSPLLPLVLLLKVPLLPPPPCSNQANLAPLPSSLTSSPAYTTLQSPDFKRNLKFRSSEIFPSQNINIPRYHILASSEWSVKFQSESLRLPLSLKMSRRL